MHRIATAVVAKAFHDRSKKCDRRYIGQGRAGDLAKRPVKYRRRKGTQLIRLLVEPSWFVSLSSITNPVPAFELSLNQLPTNLLVNAMGRSIRKLLHED